MTPAQIATFLVGIWSSYLAANAVPTGNHTCTGITKIPVTVLVNVTVPVTFRSYTWCLRVPPRCSKYTVQLKDRVQPHTEMHNKTITVCCRGYVEMDGRCVPACPEGADCPFMHCNRTNHCHCTPGYTGLYCNDPCPRGVWGKDCKRPCDCPQGYTCHHLTGDCFVDDRPVRKTTTITTTTTTTPSTTTVVPFTTEATTLETVKTPVFRFPPPSWAIDPSTSVKISSTRLTPDPTPPTHVSDLYDAKSVLPTLHPSTLKTVRPPVIKFLPPPVTAPPSYGTTFKDIHFVESPSQGITKEPILPKPTQTPYKPQTLIHALGDPFEYQNRFKPFTMTELDSSKNRGQEIPTIKPTLKTFVSQIDFDFSSATTAPTILTTTSMSSTKSTSTNVSYQSDITKSSVVTSPNLTYGINKTGATLTNNPLLIMKDPITSLKTTVTPSVQPSTLLTSIQTTPPTTTPSVTNIVHTNPSVSSTMPIISTSAAATTSSPTPTTVPPIPSITNIIATSYRTFPVTIPIPTTSLSTPILPITSSSAPTNQTFSTTASTKPTTNTPTPLTTTFMSTRTTTIPEQNTTIPITTSSLLNISDPTASLIIPTSSNFSISYPSHITSPNSSIYAHSPASYPGKTTSHERSNTISSTLRSHKKPISTSKNTSPPIKDHTAKLPNTEFNDIKFHIHGKQYPTDSFITNKIQTPPIERHVNELTTVIPQFKVIKVIKTDQSTSKGLKYPSIKHENLPEDFHSVNQFKSQTSDIISISIDPLHTKQNRTNEHFNVKAKQDGSPIIYISPTFKEKTADIGTTSSGSTFKLTHKMSIGSTPKTHGGFGQNTIENDIITPFHNTGPESSHPTWVTTLLLEPPEYNSRSKISSDDITFSSSSFARTIQSTTGIPTKKPLSKSTSHFSTKSIPSTEIDPIKKLKVINKNLFIEKAEDNILEESTQRRTITTTLSPIHLISQLLNGTPKIKHTDITPEPSFEINLEKQKMKTPKLQIENGGGVNNKKEKFDDILISSPDSQKLDNVIKKIHFKELAQAGSGKNIEISTPPEGMENGTTDTTNKNVIANMRNKNGSSTKNESTPKHHHGEKFGDLKDSTDQLPNIIMTMLNLSSMNEQKHLATGMNQHLMFTEDNSLTTQKQVTNSIVDANNHMESNKIERLHTPYRAVPRTIALEQKANPNNSDYEMNDFELRPKAYDYRPYNYIVKSEKDTAIICGVVLIAIIGLSCAACYLRRRNEDIQQMHPRIMAYEMTEPSLSDIEKFDDAFFRPTFTNNYAQKINREFNELSYDHPSSPPEPLYTEIKH